MIISCIMTAIKLKSFYVQWFGYLGVNTLEESIERKAEIILDIPAEEDAFDGGGHQRSAEALANAIEQLANRNGAIGLEGPWGSGKTTVVNLAEQVLTARKTEGYEYSVFYFDLWEHQSDDFRRAFLEEFVAWLASAQYLSSAKIKEAEDRIRDRVKTVKSYNYKKYNFLGGLFLLMSPFIPLMYSWMSPTAYTMVSGGNGPLNINWLNVGLAAFVLLYIALFIKFIVLTFGYKEKDEGTLSCGDKLGRAASLTLSLFSKEVEKEDLKQSIRESDPTTIEFHSIFRDYLSLVQEKGRRLVFVLDNIDRLPKRHVVDIWPEVRSLFSNSGSRKSKPNAWVTAVVPYDRGYIETIFDPSVDSPNEGAAKAKLPNDLVSKTFNIVLHVAPPVATGWKQFLQEQLNRCFSPSFESAVVFRIFSILKFYFNKEGVQPTPRFIINFINEVASLWMQWGDLISPESMALYILHRPVTPSSIRNSDMMDKGYLHASQVEDWQKDFAVLLFNVTPDLANQVYLNQPIIKALTNAESTAIVNLSKSKGFQVVFSEALDECLGQIGGNEPKQLSRVAENVAALSFDEGHARLVWKRLAQSLRLLQELDVNAAAQFKGLFKIIEHQDKGAVLSSASILRGVVNKNTAKVEGKVSSEAGGWLRWMESIADAVEGALSSEKASEFLSETEVPNNVEFCKALAYSCSSSERSSFSDFKFSTPKAKIIASFDVNDIVPENAAKRYLLVLDELEELFDEAGREKHILLVGDCLRGNKLSNEEDKDALFEAYMKIYEEAKSAEKLEPHLTQLVQDGTLSWYGHDAAQKKRNGRLVPIKWLTIAVLGQDKFPAVPEQHPVFGNTAAYKNWFQQSFNEKLEDEQAQGLAHCVARFKSFHPWLEYALADKTKGKFYQSVFERVLKDRKYTRLRASTCIVKYGQLKAVFGEELSVAFLGRLKDWDLKEVITKDNVLQVPSDFIQDVYGQDEQGAYSAPLEAIDSHLRGLSQEIWQEELSEEGENLRLLIMRQKTSGITMPVEVYRPALLLHTLRILEGKATVDEYRDDWKFVLGALKENNRKQLATDVFQKLKEIEVSKEGCEEFVSLYREIADEMPYTSDPDRSLDVVFSKVITSADQETRAFLEDNTQSIRQCISKASDVSRKSFIEVIESYEEGADAEGLRRARSLRESLGMPPRAANDEAEEDSSGADDEANA